MEWRYVCTCVRGTPPTVYSSLVVVSARDCGSPNGTGRHVMSCRQRCEQRLRAGVVGKELGGDDPLPLYPPRLE